VRNDFFRLPHGESGAIFAPHPPVKCAYDAPMRRVLDHFAMTRSIVRTPAPRAGGIEHRHLRRAVRLS
jgi:hypothetical protein